MPLSRRSFLMRVPAGLALLGAARPARRTSISTEADHFLINEKPTYAGRTAGSLKLEGQLLNVCVSPAIFDDLNPDTRKRWSYPDTGQWDPDRNVRELVAAMREWRRNGLLGISLNLQGGSVAAEGQDQPWRMSAYKEDGSLRPDYLARLAQVLDRADELGMALIVGLFQSGQDRLLKNEAAVKRALREAVHWLLDRGYDHVLLEIASETSVRRYSHDCLRPYRIHELIVLARNIVVKDHRLLVSTSFPSGEIPTREAAVTSDFILLRANGISAPGRIEDLVSQTRLTLGLRRRPILFSAGDSYNFDQKPNAMLAAIGAGASWGYYDAGANNYKDGFESPPVNWGPSSERKRAFFASVKELTGS